MTSECDALESSAPSMAQPQQRRRTRSFRRWKRGRKRVRHRRRNHLAPHKLHLTTDGIALEHGRRRLQTWERDLQV